MGIKSCNCFIGLASRNIKNMHQPKKSYETFATVDTPLRPSPFCILRENVWTLKISWFITKHKEHHKTMYSEVRSLTWILRCLLCERNMHAYIQRWDLWYVPWGIFSLRRQKKLCKTMHSNMRYLTFSLIRKITLKTYIF